jgi:hypothetical protein
MVRDRRPAGSEFFSEFYFLGWDLFGGPFSRT